MQDMIIKTKNGWVLNPEYEKNAKVTELDVAPRPLEETVDGCIKTLDGIIETIFKINLLLQNACDEYRDNHKEPVTDMDYDDPEKIQDCMDAYDEARENYTERKY